jgi:hypothetical protein
MSDEYKYINEYERKIIVFLFLSKSSFSTRTIAQLLVMHWNTAIKCLNDLREKNVVTKLTMGNKILWKLNSKIQV